MKSPVSLYGSSATNILKRAKACTLHIEPSQTELAPLEFQDWLSHQTYIITCDSQIEEIRIDLWALPSSLMEECLKSKDILSVEETAEAATISHCPTRTRHLAMRILTRLALSERVDQKISCDQWKIELGPYGKPELDGGQSDLSFSISHSEGLSMLAITNSKTIGIDIERLSPSGMDQLPLHILSEQENETLQNLQDLDKYQHFLQLWTLKEAYSKAVGMGFSLEFEALEFTLDPITLKIAGSPDQPSALFKTLQIEHHDQPFIMALCLMS